MTKLDTQNLVHNPDAARWRHAVGFEGRYNVSDTGLVMSLVANNAPRLLKQFAGQGYPTVSLQDHDGRRCTRRVHALVLEAFVCPRPLGLQGAHVDGNPQNNRVENLYWATAKQNSADRSRHGTQIRGEGHPGAKLSWEKVAHIRSSNERHRALAARYGVSDVAIYYVRSGRTWKGQP